MELTPDLPPQYEERMLAAKLDCDSGKGAADACHAVGEFLSVVKNDQWRGKQLTQLQKGHLLASCFALGRLLLGGKGFRRQKGANAFEEGCDLEHAPSCHHLGLLAFGRGRKWAKNIWRTRARRAWPRPATCSAALIETGSRGTPWASYLETACADGHAPADIAVMFRKGDDGGPPIRSCLMDAKDARARRSGGRGAGRAGRVI